MGTEAENSRRLPSFGAQREGGRERGLAEEAGQGRAKSDQQTQSDHQTQSEHQTRARRGEGGAWELQRELARRGGVEERGSGGQKATNGRTRDAERGEGGGGEGRGKKTWSAYLKNGGHGPFFKKENHFLLCFNCMTLSVKGMETKRMQTQDVFPFVSVRGVCFLFVPFQENYSLTILL